MKKVTVRDKVFRLMIKNKAILKSIDNVAEKINRDYRSCTEPPVLLCILNGAMPYAAELMKRLEFDHELACMKAKSYDGTQSTGKVNIIVPPTTELKGKRVIICEDIIDTGITIRELRSHLAELGVKDVRTTSLLVKPARLCAQLKKEGLVGENASQKDVEAFMPEYAAMEIPDDFIVGFGLDYDELGRNYKDIYVLDK